MQEGISLLHQQVEQNPRDSVTRFHLGLAYSAIGSTFADKGNIEDRVTAYAAAMELISQTAIHNPMDPYVQSEWGVMHLRTARALRASGESAAALQYVQRGSAIMHRVVEMHDDKPHYWRYFALFELEWGDLCRQQCDMEEATAHLGTARAVFERLVAHDPSNVEWQADLAATLSSIARTSETPRPDEADHEAGRPARAPGPVPELRSPAGT